MIRNNIFELFKPEKRHLSQEGSFSWYTLLTIRDYFGNKKESKSAKNCTDIVENNIIGRNPVARHKQESVGV
jgi:hypothetical protein